MREPSRPFDTYLRLLDVDPAPPDLDLLRSLTRAQLIRAPFENVSKLWSVRRLGRREMPDIETYLDGMERYRFGGTCYPNNIHFWSLLRHLGFDASLCGAEMSGVADVHVVILVRTEGRDHLVDAGYGAPFLEPLPLDAETDRTIALGNEEYVVRPPDVRGRPRVDHFRDGRWLHGYTVSPVHREPGHFDEIVRASYADEATFLNALRLVRFLGGSSVALHNRTLVESRPGAVKVTKLPDREAIVNAVQERFGIPSGVMREAIADLDLERLRDVHG